MFRNKKEENTWRWGEWQKKELQTKPEKKKRNLTIKKKRQIKIQSKILKQSVIPLYFYDSMTYMS
jgi:hypothetical protein